MQTKHSKEKEDWPFLKGKFCETVYEISCEVA